jgi:hypothetical protein
VLLRGEGHFGEPSCVGLPFEHLAYICSTAVRLVHKMSRCRCSLLASTVGQIAAHNRHATIWHGWHGVQHEQTPTYWACATAKAHANTEGVGSIVQRTAASSCRM